ncbi:GGDEF domain-containing protein [Notoacmeibacter ruber]|uniref:GGDEF domain-containing protein n=1 Tax=Notoacmeibacter ruber TaxID=2670375 RepID=UPI001313D84D|nr:GGDEF domain-containing protein [Notoacmeibacter ruber]
MQQSTITQADLETAIRQKSWTGKFSPALEAAYLSYVRQYHVGYLRSTIIPSLFIYNAFLIADYLLVPDSFGLTLMLHLGMVSIWILVVGLSLKNVHGPVVPQLLAVSIPILMIAQIMMVYSASESVAKEQYQYLAIPIVIYMNVVIRPDRRFALGASALITALYSTTLIVGSAPFSVKLVGISTIIAVAYLTLSANARMERDTRHAFLRRLQDEHHRNQSEEAANRDALTGLSNRRHLDSWVNANWERLAQDNISIAIVMLDIDHFKSLNDRHGHTIGDRCLEKVADLLSKNLRDTSDMAVRYGGEEFLVMLTAADLTTAKQFAERVRHALETMSLDIEEECLYLTASFGVMAGPASSHAIEELIEGADSALYNAKLSGRNRVCPPSRLRKKQSGDDKAAAAAL